MLFSQQIVSIRAQSTVHPKRRRHYPPEFCNSEFYRKIKIFKNNIFGDLNRELIRFVNDQIPQGKLNWKRKK